MEISGMPLSLEDVPESLRQTRFVFIGDRTAVLQGMIELGLNIIAIFYSPNSYLERFVNKHLLPGQVLPAKTALIDKLLELSFDFCICNGLKLILPVSQLQAGTTKSFINIHPSLLPDLRGRNPVQGALLNGRDSGATCHVMDDGTDTGQIIAQTKIPYTKDLDAWLLFQLSFLAERMVFGLALKRCFAPDNSIDNVPQAADIYYTFQAHELSIDFNHDPAAIMRKIKAFNTPLKGARFEYQGRMIIVDEAKLIDNIFVKEAFRERKSKEILLKYNNKILVKLNDAYLEFQLRADDMEDVLVGDSLA